MKAISVSELTKYIKERLELDDNLKNIFLEGEVSNFKIHQSGHWYFRLKDDLALIDCIMFRNYVDKLDFIPKEGQAVQILGDISLYEKSGSYSIKVKAMREVGKGDLYAKFEEIKQKLKDEGLFDLDKKKKIPFMPKIIGVVTSRTGAVIQDIINVSQRRNPNVYIRLIPVAVQGQGAAEQIAKAIELFNEEKLADVLIVGRGGGSIEDLWPFNEEIVARAIYNSGIPIISAVGHETDTTIADYVSDKRAPTPSAAAELAVAVVDELKQKLNNYDKKINNDLVKILNYKALYLKNLKLKLKNPEQLFDEKRIYIDSLFVKIENAFSKRFVELKNKVERAKNILEIANPNLVLKKGYAYIQKDDVAISSIKELKKNDKLKLTLVDGSKEVIVE